MSLRHSRLYIHLPRTDGERIADAVAAQMGSWRFIIIQSIVVGLWILTNLVAAFARWDPYPFILLNLLFSTQAAYAAPIIMMSQNRQAAKDHMRDDHEADEVEQLFTINEQQLQILKQQDDILDVLLHGAPGQPAGQAGPPMLPSQQASQAPHALPDALSAPPVPSKAKKGAGVVPTRRKRAS